MGHGFYSELLVHWRGPSQICGCPFREPRVFEIAHIYIYIYIYIYYILYIYYTYISVTKHFKHRRVDRIPDSQAVSLSAARLGFLCERRETGETET